MDIAILLFDGFDELDVFGPFDVLRAAGLDVALVTAEPHDVVTSAGGARVTPVATLQHLREQQRPHWLVVPGGAWASRAPRGARAEAERGVIPAFVADYVKEGTSVASVCTGAMLLAAAGVLAGRRATTHHSAFDDLAAHGATVVRDARVVDEGDVVTAGGVTSGIDLGLWLVRREVGAAAMRALERRVEHRLGVVKNGVVTSGAAPAAHTPDPMPEATWTPNLWLPATPLVRAAYDFAKSAEPPYLFNHSVRSYLFARLAAIRHGRRPDDDFDDELLFLACILHDLGLTEAANAGRRGRFEVVGAAAAAEFLADNGLPKPLADVVLDAITLHTSAGIAERHSPEAALARAGISTDFGADAAAVPDYLAEAIHGDYPRLDVGRCLVDAIVEQVGDRLECGPAYTLPGELARERREPPFVSRLEQRLAGSRWGG